MMERVAILGMGLLGTSVGLALRASGFQGAIVGWNRNRAHAETALRMGAIDRIAADPLTAARETQVTLLAVPIYATLDLMVNRQVRAGGHRVVSLRLEVFNALNRKNLQLPDSFVDHVTFGQSLSAYPPRQAQLVARFTF